MSTPPYTDEQWARICARIDTMVAALPPEGLRFGPLLVAALTEFAQEIVDNGVGLTTIEDYYQRIVDCFVYDEETP